MECDLARLLRKKTFRPQRTNLPQRLCPILPLLLLCTLLTHLQAECIEVRNGEESSGDILSVGESTGDVGGGERRAVQEVAAHSSIHPPLRNTRCPTKCNACIARRIGGQGTGNTRKNSWCIGYRTPYTQRGRRGMISRGR